MIPVYSVEQIRAAEVRAHAELGEGVLMARAVSGIVKVCREVLLEYCDKIYGSRILILAGAGNNGADAMWSGAELAKRGCQVVAVLASENYDEPTAARLIEAGGRLEASDISVTDFERLASNADLVLDGLLGIGARGGLREPAAQWSRIIAESDAVIVAVDLPSGLDPDTGLAANPEAVICADYTVCIGTLKAGLVLGDGDYVSGELILHDIGLRKYFHWFDGAKALFQVIDADDALDCIGVPKQNDNKYSRGVVGVATGSEIYPGAAVLSTGGALRGGSGMVRYAGGARDAVASHWPEVVLADHVDLDSKTNAWVVGSGGGVDAAAQERLAKVLKAQTPVVIDADGLTLLAESDELESAIRDRNEAGLVTVLTPHDGEFARLGYPVASIDDFPSRLETLRQAASDLGAVILLKGACTLISTPDGHVYVNDESSPALATAGSGDVLAGLLGSMLAQRQAILRTLADIRIESNIEPGVFQLGNDSAAEIAACAALIHGHAGIEAARTKGSVVAMDILEALPIVLKQLAEADMSDGVEEEVR